MGVLPARPAVLVCDHCGKVIHSGATTIAGKRMMFRSIDRDDIPAPSRDVPTFIGTPVPVYYHAHHLDSVPPTDEPEE